MTTVLIVEDYARLGAMYEQLLATSGEISCVGQAADAAEAIRMARERQPDIVLLDISLPDANALSIIQNILETCRGVQIVVLGEEDNEEYRIAAILCGASGYLRKEQTVEQLVPLIQRLAGMEREAG